MYTLYKTFSTDPLNESVVENNMTKEQVDWFFGPEGTKLNRLKNVEEYTGEQDASTSEGREVIYYRAELDN